MRTLCYAELESIQGGNTTGWWFACGVGVAFSASLLGALVFGPSTAAVCYCAASGSC